MIEKHLETEYIYQFWYLHSKEESNIEIKSDLILSYNIENMQQLKMVNDVDGEPQGFHQITSC